MAVRTAGARSEPRKLHPSSVSSTALTSQGQLVSPSCPEDSQPQHQQAAHKVTACISRNSLYRKQGTSLALNMKLAQMLQPCELQTARLQ